LTVVDEGPTNGSTWNQRASVVCTRSVSGSGVDPEWTRRLTSGVSGRRSVMHVAAFVASWEAPFCPSRRIDAQAPTQCVRLFWRVDGNHQDRPLSAVLVAIAIAIV
jgi:hypothetical protein